MTAIIEHTLIVQLADAVDMVRSARHHPDCRCNLYRDTNTAGYCSSKEHTACTILNHLLTKVA